MFKHLKHYLKPKNNLKICVLHSGYENRFLVHAAQIEKVAAGNFPFEF